MEFEEMQVIWDSQTNRKMYALDHAALEKLVEKRARAQARSVNLDELVMIGICLLVAGVQLREPLFEGTDRHQVVGAVLFIGVASFTWLARFFRKRDEREFDSTLLGDLDRAIHRVDYQVKRSQTFALWFLIPAGIDIAVGMWAKQETNDLSSWAVSIGSFLLALFVVRLGLRCGLLPAKRELESLRAKLAE